MTGDGRLCERPGGDGPAGDRPSSEGLAGDGPAGDGRAGDVEAHLAALLAVLSAVGTRDAPEASPLQRWRARRLAALSASAARTDRPASPR